MGIFMSRNQDCHHELENIVTGPTRCKVINPNSNRRWLAQNDWIKGMSGEGSKILKWTIKDAKTTQKSFIFGYGKSPVKFVTPRRFGVQLRNGPQDVTKWSKSDLDKRALILENTNQGGVLVLASDKRKILHLEDSGRITLRKQNNGRYKTTWEIHDDIENGTEVNED